MQAAADQVVKPESALTQVDLAQAVFLVVVAPAVKATQAHTELALVVLAQSVSCGPV